MAEKTSKSAAETGPGLFPGMPIHHYSSLDNHSNLAFIPRYSHKAGKDYPENLWAIILAGGEGSRLKPFTEKWLGYHCPKQFCTFVGSRSMLEHTIDRVSQVVSPNRILIVAGYHQLPWLDSFIRSENPGHYVLQPANQGTAPGIFLPASLILESDPKASVLIFPCDHFIHPENRFPKYLKRIARLSDQVGDQLILLGVRPNRPETEYGWIESGSSIDLDEETAIELKSVETFREKPSRGEALTFLENSFLWNTMIMGMKIRTLWKLGLRYLPEMMRHFETLRSYASNGWEELDCEKISKVLLRLRKELGSIDFSSRLLQNATPNTAVMAMDDLFWDDWGKPDRIIESLARIGKTPVFMNSVLENSR